MTDTALTMDDSAGIADFIGECACSNVRLVARAVTRLYDYTEYVTNIRHSNTLNTSQIYITAVH